MFGQPSGHPLSQRLDWCWRFGVDFALASRPERYQFVSLPLVQNLPSNAQPRPPRLLPCSRPTQNRRFFFADSLRLGTCMPRLLPQPRNYQHRHRRSTQHTATAVYPLASDPVRVCRSPNADGPKKPAIFAIVLATPNAPAAAVSLRISVWIAQNIGR